MTVFRASSHLALVDLDEQTVFAGHPFYVNFALTGATGKVLRALVEKPASMEQLQAQLSLTAEEINEALTFLCCEHFALRSDQDEEALIREHLQRIAARGSEGGDRLLKDVAYIGRAYRDYSPIDARGSSVQGGGTRQVSYLIVGGCLTQFAADALQRMAPSFGIEAVVEETFPSLVESAIMERPDVVVFQPSTMMFMQRLWDDAPFITDEERGVRLQMLKDELRLFLDRVRARARGALFLVHGFVAPAYSPLGRTEFRHTYHFYRIVYELNQLIMESIKDDPNAMFIDEERLLAAEGKLRLVDHALSTFSHHGPIDMIANRGETVAESLGIAEPNRAPRLFARAYLDAYALWKGIGRIKCVIVDLDNTLWTGLASEDDFVIDEHRLLYGTLAGLHQALKIVRQRGVLLAVCSRNNEADVERAWAKIAALAEKAGALHLLGPRDFVIQRINWAPKSENIGHIMRALGLSPADVLFIDDSAIERTEVQTAFPAMRVLGEDMSLVRSVLLDDPGLQVNVATRESASRSEMVRAQLLRDEMKQHAPDELSFLRGLSIRLDVLRLRERARLPRVVELLQRTNQFNTTLLGLDGAEVSRYIDANDGAVYVLEAADRFTRYGLVGVCVLREHRVVSLVMSCRIIPLRAEVPFLAAVLNDYGRAPIEAEIVEGPRNQPCRHVYTAAGFQQTGAGQYRLAELSMLTAVDYELYGLTCRDESNDSTQMQNAAAAP
jgi:FkbH-like protein